jgi:hypothetical protein
MLFGRSSDLLFRSDAPYPCSDHRDMDEWSLALLSCKLNLIGVETGGIIKHRGDKSEYAYILLGGGAKVPLYLVRCRLLLFPHWRRSSAGRRIASRLEKCCAPSAY